jgi:tRNA uridine 5-carbamoylmethylation protein Kti12
MFLNRFKFIEDDHLCMPSTLMTSSVDIVSLNYDKFFGFMYYLFILVLQLKKKKCILYVAVPFKSLFEDD